LADGALIMSMAGAERSGLSSKARCSRAHFAPLYFVFAHDLVRKVCQPRTKSGAGFFAIMR
jgi:hypothetical protein